MDHVLDWELSQ